MGNWKKLRLALLIIDTQTDFLMKSQESKNQECTGPQIFPDQPRLTPEKPSEAEIWKKFKHGDESAFIWIYKNYFTVLYNFARQFEQDSDAVKDHIQELFIYIRNNRNRLTDVQSIKFYLFKSLRRRLLSDKKRKFSFLSIFNSESKCSFDVELSDSPEIKLINQTIESEKKERLTNSMKKLTLRQKEAVVHFFYEGLSYKEIAEIMELKMVKSARKLIYRAIDTLRVELQDFKASSD